MKRALPLFIIAFVSSFFINAAHAQAPKNAYGLILDDSLYNSSPRLAAGSKAANTIPKFSLKDYTPFPGNQGECSSCVCWASCYTALTTTWAYKQSLTSKKAITDIAKSPMFVYVQITNSCTSGSRISDALKILKNEGTCSIYDFHPQNYNGENPANEIDPLKPIAYPYHIKDYAAVFPLNADSATKIDQTKLSIVNHQPVIAGFILYPSFNFVNKQNFLWHPDPSKENKSQAHAMCVIGYNDYEQTFEVMNSWGIGWGNDGYFDISYQDFVKLAVYGYQITIDDRPAPEDPIKVNGDFVVQKATSYDTIIKRPLFDNISPKLVNNEYTLSQGELGKDDYFRLLAKNVSPNCYIYIFDIDPNNKAQVLYPFSQNAQFSAEHNLKPNVTEVTRQYSNSIVEIPGNDKVIQTDVAGVDKMCILYSYNQIDDISTVVNKIQASTKTELIDKLKDVLGSRIMPQNTLRYQPDRMSVSAFSNSGDIVPIILKVTVN